VLCLTECSSYSIEIKLCNTKMCYISSSGEEIIDNFEYVPYFPAYSAHLTYNAHPKLFAIPFEVQITRTTFVTLCMYLCTDHLVICGQLENCTLTFFCVHWPRKITWVGCIILL
jgi:hypothetical protein